MIAGSSHCSDSCKFRVGVAENILTRQNIYACLLIYALQARIVKRLLWTHSLRWWGWCLLSLALCYFSAVAPMVPVLVHVEHGQLWILFSLASNLPADKRPVGKVQDERCQQASTVLLLQPVERGSPPAEDTVTVMSTNQVLVSRFHLDCIGLPSFTKLPKLKIKSKCAIRMQHTAGTVLIYISMPVL